MKKLATKFILKFLAICDIINSEKFVLKIYKSGKIKTTTTYDKDGFSSPPNTER